MAAPIVGKDRESVANYQMSTREDQFTNLHTFNFFVGTWNVNGQSPGTGDFHIRVKVEDMYLMCNIIIWTFTSKDIIDWEEVLGVRRLLFMINVCSLAP